MSKQEWIPFGKYINKRWLPTALRVDNLPGRKRLLAKNRGPVFDSETDALTYCDWEYLKHNRNVDNRELAARMGDKPEYQVY